MPKLFALLVAINDYHKDSGVPNLHGCENDVNAVDAFLRKNYATSLTDSKQIRIVKNADATRDGLLKAFDEHLIKQAKPGDTALFFYSGHGSSEDSTPDFNAFDTAELNETLVCHDSRLPGKWDIADKELAVLLSRIPNGVQRVVVLDCCHSGSATRSVSEAANLGVNRLIVKRFSEKRDGGADKYFRSLEQYMLPGDGYYTNQKKTLGRVEVPVSDHVLMAACDRNESALETPDKRGLFSKTMLEVLAAYDCKISYSELAQQVRAVIKSNAGDQTPMLDNLGMFDTGLQFLSNVRADRAVYKAQFNAQRSQWELVQMGGAQGMPLASDDLKTIKVELWLATSRSKSPKTISATVTKVFPNYSVLNVKNTTTLKADVAKTYNAAFSGFPVNQTLLVRLNMADADKKSFITWAALWPNPFVSFVPTTAAAPYEIKLVNGQMLLYSTVSKQLMYGLTTFTQGSMAYMADVLGRVARWERLMKLKKRGENINENDFVVSLNYKPFGAANTPIAFSMDAGQDNMLVALDYEKRDGAWQNLNTDITVQNKGGKDAYVAVLYQSRKFQIWQMYSSTLLAAKKTATITVSPLGIGDVTMNEITDNFKIFVSSTPLDLGSYSQKPIPLGQIDTGIPAARDMGDDLPPAVVQDDWFLRSVAINISRCVDVISGNREVKMPNEGITIMAHTGVKANVGILPIKSNTRNVSDESRLSDIFAQIEGADLVSFGPATRGTTPPPDKTIIELSNVQGADTITAANPLKISFAQKLDKGENLMALAMDAESGLILPFGNWSTDKDGQQVLSVSKLPAAAAPNTKRAPWQSFRFALVKILFKADDDAIYQLRRVNTDENGTVTRTKDGLTDAMADPQVKKVLLYIHGIIGETKGEAAILAPLATQKGYDLMLTFDYETLNSPIETTAQKFYAALTAAGFNANDGRELHIIAHSMGGLVSRWMIEQIPGGSAIVNRLIMCGTPNGGSVFGKLPSFLTTMQWLLGITVNFVSGPIGHFATVIGGVLAKATNVSGKVTVALAQMDSESDFIKALAKSVKPANVDYVVLAGNIHKFVPPGGAGKLAALIEKLESGVGMLAYQSTPNDIAVSTENIKKAGKLAKDKIMEVPCHHLNYFTHEPSLNEVIKLL